MAASPAQVCRAALTSARPNEKVTCHGRPRLHQGATEDLVTLMAEDVYGSSLFADDAKG